MRLGLGDAVERLGDDHVVVAGRAAPGSARRRPPIVRVLGPGHVLVGSAGSAGFDGSLASIDRCRPRRSSSTSSRGP